MKLYVDAAICTGHGLCYASAPDLFVDDDQGYGHVLDDGIVPDGNQEKAREAVGIRPEGAIALED